jgi:hypothetical protein
MDAIIIQLHKSIPSYNMQTSTRTGVNEKVATTNILLEVYDYKILDNVVFIPYRCTFLAFYL